MLIWIYDNPLKCILVFFLIVVNLLLTVDIPYDSTDNAGQKERSGLSLYTDHLTGCQYLGVGFSGLTPRLNVKGLHEGCK
jgi:hypothetical protein